MEHERGGRREFIDWLAVAYTVATALALLSLIAATQINSDEKPPPVVESHRP